MINLKGGAGGRQSDAAKHDSFRRTEEVLKDSGSVCVWHKSQEFVCVCIRVCVFSSQLEVTEDKVLMKCMK